MFTPIYSRVVNQSHKMEANQLSMDIEINELCHVHMHTPHRMGRGAKKNHLETLQKEGHSGMF